MANYLLAANNAISTLAGSISNTATSANLASGSGALFPNPGSNQYFCATLIDAATGLLREIVHVTAISTDTVTIVRAQEGTTALNWNAGDLFQNLWTAGSMAALQQPGQWYAADGGVANSLIITLTPTPASLAALTGITITVKVAATNTAPPVIDVNSFGNVAIVNTDGSTLGNGQLKTGMLAQIMYDGTHFQLVGASAAPGGVQVYTTHVSSPFTFTIPAPNLDVWVWGAGGGGGAAGALLGSGGGGGQLSFKHLTGLTVGNTLTVTIGTGGTGGPDSSTTDGTNGGNSSVTSGTQTITAINANGGGGGPHDSTAGGAGGSGGTGGDWTMAGETSSVGSVIGAVNFGGGGGGSPQGGVGAPSGGTGGFNGVWPGGGGGGGSSGSGVSSTAGGNGADGGVIIKWAASAP